MEKIQRMFKKAKEYGDEKVSIAIQTYEMVDKHIRRLDGDLAKFEAEMREKGRLSQTETEDEDDGIDDENGGDDNGNKKGSSGVRGRKNKSGQTPAAGSNSKKKKGQKVRHNVKLILLAFELRLDTDHTHNYQIFTNLLGPNKGRKRRFWYKKWKENKQERSKCQ